MDRIVRIVWLCLWAVTAACLRAQDPLPDGTGKALVERICTECHPIGIAISSPKTAAGWRSTVADMKARGAHGTPDEMGQVVEYLTAHFGVTGAPEGETTARAGVAAEETAPPPLTKAQQAVKIAAKYQWPSYGYDAGGTRYSPLTQINKGNVSRLRRVWTFHLGESGSEDTPLVTNSTMYLTAADGIYAVVPETGELLWKFPSSAVARRGLAYWPGDATTHPRLFCGVERGKMVALDATTGKPAVGFANEGFLDLKQGVLDGYEGSPFFLQSPPAVYRDVIITGGNNNEPAPSRGAHGDVRGWDARTGRLLWTFHTVPRAGEPGNETWAAGTWEHRSGTNVWGLMTVDVERGLVFLPIGAPTYDMYGADRPGIGLYGNSLVALDAATGRVKWFQQLVHHDLWDYDLAAPPALIDVVRGGKRIPAVAQITKMGLLFIFDRVDGRPIFGMEERPVPKSEVPGEQSSPTQPFPVKPRPLAKNMFDLKELYSLTPEHAAFCKALFEDNQMFTEGPFTPMPVAGNALTFPSTLGGGNWGGVSFNPALGLVFVNVMDLGQWGHMAKKSVPQVSGAKNADNSQNKSENGPNKSGIVTSDTDYVRTAPVGGQYARFWDPANHVPCQNPPFGELIAVNADTGDIAWRVPLGFIEELAKKGFAHTGTVNLGGSITTASGLTFIAATNDGRLRGFDSRTGEELWAQVLDAPAYTVPVTYLGRNGRQYVAVVAGGGGFWQSPTSNSVIAFALPSTPETPSGAAQ